MADVTVDGEIRNYFLEASRTGREDLMATETFEGVVEVMEPRSLYRDNWFSPRGRSNRAEYLAVLIVAVVISGMAQRVASLLPEFWSLVPLALGTAVMVWLIWAAIARRCHDLGWAFRWLALVMVVGSGVAEAAEGHFQLSFPWPSALLVCVPILAFAILPGEPRENRYDPPPNPGLAL